MGEIPLRRALWGYGSRATQAYLAELEAELETVRAERDKYLNDLLAKLGALREENTTQEALLSREQAEYYEALGKLSMLSEASRQQVESVRSELSQQELQWMGDLASKEVKLGARHRVIESVPAELSRILKRLEREVGRPEVPNPPGAAKRPALESMPSMPSGKESERR